MGGWDKGNTTWRRISQSEIRKIAAAKKEAAKARGEGETNRLWWNLLEKVRTFYQENPDAD